MVNFGKLNVMKDLNVTYLDTIHFLSFTERTDYMGPMG
jgi:hypothetical protein